ncbi:MAG: hypothetical protein HQ564_00295 [Candidatus Saganbacteria bacterium]|nr:hypothetical protein [Candidatus Saganbacteria bacterium]
MKKIVLALGLIIFIASISFAVPGQINVQGVLRNSSGTLIDGSKTITFTIYTADSGGTKKWENSLTVLVKGGIYNVQLGKSKAIAPTVFDGTPRYLGIKLSGESERTPRMTLLTVPYAFRASVADSLSSGNFAEIGPSAEQTTSTQYGLRVNSSHINGYGVYGSGSGFGVYGKSTSGVGVRGSSTSQDGVYGTSAGAVKSGVYGSSNNSAGFGLVARNTTATKVSDTGAALLVDGRIKMSTGSGKAAGTRSGSNANWTENGAVYYVNLTNFALTANSLIFIFPIKQPAGRWWVENEQNSTITVYSTASETTNNPDFNYLIIN